MRDCGAVIGDWRCRALVRIDDPGKIFKNFSENRDQNTICLAITPIEGHLPDSGLSGRMAGIGKIRNFFKNLGPFFNLPGSDPDREFVCESGQNLVFLLSVCQKNLNKGDDGLWRVHRWMSGTRTCRDGRIQKIFEKFSENRGQNTPLGGNNPDRDISSSSPGKTTFLKKSENP